jgi:hypothetical protein
MLTDIKKVNIFAVKEAEKYENTLLSVKYAVVEFTNT